MKHPNDKALYIKTESAYRVEYNYGIYKGVQVRVADYQKDTGKIYIMVDDDEQGKALGIEPWKITLYFGSEENGTMSSVNYRLKY